MISDSNTASSKDKTLVNATAFKMNLQFEGDQHLNMNNTYKTEKAYMHPAFTTETSLHSSLHKDLDKYAEEKKKKISPVFAATSISRI